MRGLFFDSVSVFPCLNSTLVDINCPSREKWSSNSKDCFLSNRSYPSSQQRIEAQKFYEHLSPRPAICAQALFLKGKKGYLRCCYISAPVLTYFRMKKGRATFFDPKQLLRVSCILRCYFQSDFQPYIDLIYTKISYCIQHIILYRALQKPNMAII